ncbi:hypothetical protein HPP92_025260 [Vanilla planifolia]|uniref:GPI inositol-deacylase n=1 Tax=Vanilla planifolia TaxID=51239 RepID=A0A835UC53_VANPL|nr:hypothetical protein HPP92_025260 [Vanilla planifolia]
MTSLPTPPSSNLIASKITLPSPSYATAATRPVVVLPGLGNNSGDYRGLTATLKDGYGIPSMVARVSRFDWLRNAAGLIDPDYWRGTLRPRPVLDWYLERVKEAVSEAKELCLQGGSIALIGHSAGGWLARVYMEEFGKSDISLLLTLGTPHLPPPKGIAGVIDQTRGLLDYVEKNCAPAVYTSELKYICISGRYIRGARMVGKAPAENEGIPESTEKEDNGGSQPAHVAPTLRTRFIGQGYKQQNVVEVDEDVEREWRMYFRGCFSDGEDVMECAKPNCSWKFPQRFLEALLGENSAQPRLQGSSYAGMTKAGSAVVAEVRPTNVVVPNKAP